MTRNALKFTLNGGPVEAEAEPWWTAVDLLRRGLQRTGTKLGCGVGVCGVCSVLVDGELVSACLVPALYLDGGDVVTVEGLASTADGVLSPLQQAFIEEGGFQCGICTPGQLVAATALLRENPQPTNDEIADWMMGNLCRCTGYYGIRRAIRAVADSTP